MAVALPLPARRMLTERQAAEYCGFESVQGFQAYIRVAGEKFGRNVLRYDVRDLDEALDKLRNARLHAGGGKSFAELAGNGDGADHGR